MRKFLSLIAAIAIFMSCSGLATFADEGIKVLIDSKAVKFDVPPQIIKSRTMVPMRAIFEAIGAQIQWDDATKKVTGIKNKNTIELTIGARTAKKNGNDMLLDSPAVIVDGRTLVPVRFVSESLGLTVGWDQATQTVSLSTYRDTMADVWPAIDELDRIVPTYTQTGLPREDKTVGMFYYIWTTKTHLANLPIRDITKIRAGAYDWNGINSFHYWGEPFMGYYDSQDPYIIRKHCQMLVDAGVDVIFFDNTNAIIYKDVIKQILTEYTDIRANGGKTPDICSLLHSSTATTARQIYNAFFDPDKVDEETLEMTKNLWYKWEDNKYFMLANKKEIETAYNEAKEKYDAEAAPGVTITKNYLDYKALLEQFTFRDSWAWVDGKEDVWAWLANYPQKYGWHKDASIPEQVSVATAQHPTNQGKSASNNIEPPITEIKPKEGIYFAEQWARALEIDPRFILVTQFNEWVAQRFIQQKPGKYAGEPINAGDSYFVDVYDWEFNRDIEPMRNNGDYGWGDNYYYQLVSNIRKYKGVRPAPTPSGAKTIDINAGFSQWADVKPEFLDNLDDTMHRDYKSSGKVVEGRADDEFFYTKDGQSYYKNTTGRNNFDTVKIAQDKNNIYFYVKTVDPITPAQSKMWMNLYLNVDRNQTNGFHGYDYMINRSVNTSAMTGTIEKAGTGWNWSKVGDTKIVMSRNELMLSIPRNLIGLQNVSDATIRIDFKWSDNTPYTDKGMDLMDFIDKGDTAPNGRFNYRYTYDPEM